MIQTSHELFPDIKIIVEEIDDNIVFHRRKENVRKARLVNYEFLFEKHRNIFLNYDFFVYQCSTRPTNYQRMRIFFFIYINLNEKEDKRSETKEKKKKKIPKDSHRDPIYFENSLIKRQQMPLSNN